MTINMKIRTILLVVTCGLIILGCANRGQGPQGGPKDEVPPMVTGSTPQDRATNVKESKIFINFDENINVKNQQNVIVSPPQLQVPTIQSYGKRISVELLDTLQKETTYSIFFGDAIEDNNEGNKMDNYFFSFSTGNVIDTLQLSGMLINAENLNPMKGINVGIYAGDADSLIFTTPFHRLARSNDKGEFLVPGAKPIQYRVYALNDVNRDNYYTYGEGVAFDTIFYQASSEKYMRQDTIWKDTVTIDTIREVETTRFLPNNIVLRYFKPDAKRQYLVQSHRTTPHKIDLIFNDKNKTLPQVHAINYDNWDKHTLLQTSATLDTLGFWLTDSLLIKQDTLLLQIDYLKSDSLFRLVPQTDTITLTYRKPKADRNARKDDEKEQENSFLNINTNLSSNFDVYLTTNIHLDTPVKCIDKDGVIVSQVKDSLLIPIDAELVPLDSIRMNYKIDYAWKPETKYQLVIDSAAITDVYGVHNKKTKYELLLKSVEEYATLIIKLSAYDSTAVLQVLNNRDKVVRSTKANPKGTKIEHLPPGDYYVRLFLDANGNGKWDTGDLKEKRQPEMVFYYNKKLTLIKNWEIEETWNHLATPVLEQKPKELIKSEENK